MNNLIDNHRERGAALITVLLIFSIGAIIIMTILSRQKSDIERTAAIQNNAQAYYYALGAEELARQILASDAKAMPNADHPGQKWARTNEGIPIENGSLTLHIEDLQSRFNINNLMGGMIAPKAYLQQLLSRLGLSSNLSAFIIDQVDSIPTYPLPNFPRLRMQDNVSILRQAGLSEEEYAALEPYLTALPQPESQLNVNTAPDILLKIYIPDEEVYKRLMMLQSKYGFVKNQELRSIGMNTKDISATSNYFQMTAEATVNAHTIKLISIIYRDINAAGNVSFRIISRDLNRV